MAARGPPFPPQVAYGSTSTTLWEAKGLDPIVAWDTSSTLYFYVCVLKQFFFSRGIQRMALLHIFLQVCLVATGGGAGSRGKG